MRNKSFQWVGHSACVLTLLIAAQQAAGTVRVDVFSTIGGTILDTKTIHPTFAELGPITPSASLDTGEAHAIADGLSADSLLKVKATSTINGSSVRTVAAHATWEDTLLVTGPTAAPSDIRLTFTIDGQLSIDLVTGGSLGNSDVSRAVLNIITASSLGFFEPLGTQLKTAPPAIATGFLVRAEQISKGGTFQTLNVDVVAGIDQAWVTTPSLIETSPGVYDFTGTVGITTPFDATSGGYNAALSLTALAGGRRSTSSSDFFGTAKLTSVALPDGSPLPTNLNFSFDSGLTFIPEPSAAALFTLATLTLINRRHHA